MIAKCPTFSHVNLVCIARTPVKKGPSTESHLSPIFKSDGGFSEVPEIESSTVQNISLHCGKVALFRKMIRASVIKALILKLYQDLNYIQVAGTYKQFKIDCPTKTTDR